MNAFHCNWTRPYFREHPKEYKIEDFELLTTILSALKWREHNGNIKMVTDAVGADYYRALGIADLWDLGIEEILEDVIPSTLNAELFWAAGKLYALQSQQAPCVMLDTDFIVWQNIQLQLEQSKVTVIHHEPLLEDVYPDASAFCVDKTYSFHPDWDWQELACNTAFAAFREEAFKQYYVEEAIRFMTHVTGGSNKITYMVFAEQRMLSLCAKERGISIQALMTLEQLHQSKQEMYTHIWGYKQELKRDGYIREVFCRRCIARIIEDFPEWEERLMTIPPLARYFD